MHKILLIEDDQGITLNLVTYLEEEGYEVEHACTGEEALDILSSFTPDVAIVDIRLPGMDGNQLMKEIMRTNDGIKFVIHTGYIDYTVPDSLQRQGITAQNVLYKPLPNLGVMLDAINRVTTS